MERMEKKGDNRQATESARITVQGKVTGCDKASCAGVKVKYGKGRMTKK